MMMCDESNMDAYGNDLLTPREVADALRISTSTITRCVKRGAPVHRWGSTGCRYRIRVSELVEWMEHQGEKQDEPQKISSADELARKRREYMRRI